MTLFLDMVVDPEEFVVTYYKPFLEVPIQVDYVFLKIKIILHYNII